MGMVGWKSILSIQAQLKGFLAALAIDNLISDSSVCADLACSDIVFPVPENEALDNNRQ
jgi:hypothetical protein